MTTLPQTTTTRPALGPVPAGGSHAAAPAAGAGSQLTGADVQRIIWANLWLILLILILCGGAGYGLNYYWLKNAPRYTAVGWLEIKDARNPLAPKEDLLADQRTLTEQRTQAQKLTMDSLFSKVLSKDSDLTKTDWYRYFKQQEQTLKEPFTKAARADLQDNFLVQPVPETRLLKVLMTAGNPKDARTIIEEIVETHLQQQSLVENNRRDEDSKAIQSMDTSLSNTLRELTDRIRKRQADLTRSGMGMAGQFSAREMELKVLMEERMQRTKEASQAASMFRRVKGQQDRGDIPGQVDQTVENDPTVAALARELLSYEIQRDSEKTRLLPEMTQMVKLASLITETGKRLADRRAELRAKYADQLVTTLKSSAEQAEADVKAIDAEIAKHQDELTSLSRDLAELVTLQEEAKSLRDRQTQVRDRQRDIDNMSAMMSRSRIDWAVNGHPEIPEMPTFPRLRYTMFGAIALGLMLAMGLAFLREMLNDTVRSPKDVSRVGQIPLLGMIADEADDPQAEGARLAIFDAPHSLTAEQFRQVRTRLQHAASLDTMRSIMVTGPGPQDGKTTVAANLAAGLALNGRRILLIDANFRRPDLHRIFGLPNQRGFSDVLTGSAPLAEAAGSTNVPNLSVLVSGPKPANATELFESRLFTEFLERALESYDHVLFDTGPVLFVSESGALAPRVDGVITVVRAHAESRGMLQRLRDQLKLVKAEHLGVILNAVRARRGGYYRRNIRTYYNYSNGE